MENAVTESDRLSGIDKNVCILHDNTSKMFLGIDEKYETVYLSTVNFKSKNLDLGGSKEGVWYEVNLVKLGWRL